jgi:methionine salvage enolase-phosphatase E1
MQNIAIYKAYVTDVMGTTTPLNHVNELRDYSLRPEVVAQISAKTGRSIDDIANTIKEGSAQGQAGNKDHPAFKDYIGIGLSDIGQQIGYGKKDLVMGLEEGVEEAAEKIDRAGGQIFVFSSGTNDASRLGMSTNNLGKMVGDTSAQQTKL